MTYTAHIANTANPHDVILGKGETPRAAIKDACGQLGLRASVFTLARGERLSYNSSLPTLSATIATIN